MPISQMSVYDWTEESVSVTRLQLSGVKKFTNSIKPKQKQIFMDFLTRLVFIFLFSSSHRAVGDEKPKV